MHTYLLQIPNQMICSRSGERYSILQDQKYILETQKFHLGFLYVGTCSNILDPPIEQKMAILPPRCHLFQHLLTSKILDELT